MRREPEEAAEGLGPRAMSAAADDGPDRPRGRWPAAATLLAGVPLALVLAAALAPVVHYRLLLIGRSREPLAFMRDWTLEEVASRLALAGMLAVLAGVWLRWKECFAVRRDRTGLRWRLAAAGWGFGVASTLGAVLAGGLAGAYRIPASALPGALAALAVFSPIGLLIALIEESAFRLVLFGGLKEKTNRWTAAALSSFLFALVHILTPQPETALAHPGMRGGWMLLGAIFHAQVAVHQFFPYLLNLWLMGIVLCLVLERTGRLIAVVGLHAGWVAGLKCGARWAEPGGGPWLSVFGPGDILVTSYAATILLLILIAGLGIPAHRRKPEGKAG